MKEFFENIKFGEKISADEKKSCKISQSQCMLLFFPTCLHNT